MDFGYVYVVGVDIGVCVGGVGGFCCGGCLCEVGFVLECGFVVVLF